MSDDLEDTKPHKGFSLDQVQPMPVVHLDPDAPQEFIEKYLEDTKPHKAVNFPATSIEDFLKSKKKDPIQVKMRSPKVKIISTEQITTSQPRFSWVAFFVMGIAIGAAWLLGVLIPGPFDDVMYDIVIASIYGFLYAHGFSVKNIFKK